MFVLFWATILIYFGVIYHNNIETVKKKMAGIPPVPCAPRVCTPALHGAGTNASRRLTLTQGP